MTMDNQTLIDALNQSIEWLSEGRTPSDCLRAYPELADQLAPMLETRMIVRRIQIKPAEIAAAQDRVRLRVRQRQQRYNQTTTLLRGLAAVLVVCFGVILVGQAPIIASLFPQFQATATASLTQLPDATATPTPTMQATATTEPQQPIIQITRHTTPTTSRPIPTRTVPPTSLPASTDDHGGSDDKSGNVSPTSLPASTDDHGGNDDKSGKDS